MSCLFPPTHLTKGVAFIISIFSSKKISASTLLVNFLCLYHDCTIQKFNQNCLANDCRTIVDICSRIYSSNITHVYLFLKILQVQYFNFLQNIDFL